MDKVVFWISSIYFSHLIGCNDFDYQDSIWNNGWPLGSFDIFWNNHIHDKNRAKAPKLYSKMDQYEFCINDWIKLDFE